MTLRVVTLPLNGQPARAVLCACGQHVTNLSARCPYCGTQIVPDHVDLAAWDAARPLPRTEWAR